MADEAKSRIHVMTCGHLCQGPEATRARTRAVVPRTDECCRCWAKRGGPLDPTQWCAACQQTVA